MRKVVNKMNLTKEIKGKMKILYFDVETTGLDPLKNDITQLAGLIEIDGKIVEEFNFRCQPLDWKAIESRALEVTGIGLNQLKKFDKPDKAYKQFLNLLGNHVDKFDREDKMYFAGYNVRFDIDFLHNFFKKQNDKYFGSWFNWRAIDPLSILYWFSYMGRIDLENYKLETVCKHYGIKIDAHDALSDVKATRKIIQRLRKELLKGGEK